MIMIWIIVGALVLIGLIITYIIYKKKHMDITLNTYYQIDSSDNIDINNGDVVVLDSGSTEVPVIDFDDSPNNNITLGNESTIIVKSKIRNANIIGNNSIIIAENNSYLFDNCTFDGSFINSTVYATNFGAIDNMGSYCYHWDWCNEHVFVHDTNINVDKSTIENPGSINNTINSNIEPYDNLSYLNEMFKVATYFKHSNFILNGAFYTDFSDDSQINNNVIKINNLDNINITGKYIDNGVEKQGKIMTGLLTNDCNNLNISYINFVGYHDPHELPFWDVQNVFKKGTNEYTTKIQEYPWKMYYDLYGTPYRHDISPDRYKSVGLAPAAIQLISNCKNVYIENCDISMRYSGIGAGKKYTDYDSWHGKSQFEYYYDTALLNQTVVGTYISNCTFTYMLWQPLGSHGRYTYIHDCVSYYAQQGLDFSEHSNNCYVYNSKFYGNTVGFKNQISSNNLISGWETSGNETTYYSSDESLIDRYFTYNNKIDNIYYEMSNKTYYDIVHGNDNVVDHTYGAPINSSIIRLPYFTPSRTDYANTLSNTVVDFNHAYTTIFNKYELEFLPETTYLDNFTFNVNWSNPPYYRYVRGSYEFNNVMYKYDTIDGGNNYTYFYKNKLNWTTPSGETISARILGNTGSSSAISKTKRDIECNSLIRFGERIKSPITEVDGEPQTVEITDKNVPDGAGGTTNVTHTCIKTNTPLDSNNIYPNFITYTNYDTSYLYINNCKFNLNAPYANTISSGGEAGNYYTYINNSSFVLKNPDYSSEYINNVVVLDNTGFIGANGKGYIFGRGFNNFTNYVLNSDVTIPDKTVLDDVPVRFNNTLFSSPSFNDTSNDIIIGLKSYVNADNKNFTNVKEISDKLERYTSIDAPEEIMITTYSDDLAIYDSVKGKGVINLGGELIIPETINDGNYIQGIEIEGNNLKITVKGDDKERVIFGDDVTFSGTFKNSQLYATNFGFIEGLEKRPYKWTHGGKVPTWTKYGDDTWHNSYVSTYIWTYVHTNNPDYVTPYNGATDISTNNINAKNRLGQFLSYSYNIDLCFNGDFFFDAAHVRGTDETTSNDGGLSIRKHITIRNARNLNIYGRYGKKWRTNSNITGGFSFQGGNNIELHHINFVGYHGVHEFPASFAPNQYAAYLMPLSLMKETADNNVSTTDLHNFREFAEKFQSYMPYKGLIDRFGYLYTFYVSSNWDSFGKKYFKNYSETRIGYFGLVDAPAFNAEESTFTYFNLSANTDPTRNYVCYTDAFATNKSGSTVYRNVFKFLDNNNNQTLVDNGKPRAFFDPTCQYYNAPAKISKGTLVNLKNWSTNTYLNEETNVYEHGRHTYIYVDYEGTDGSCVMTNIMNNSKYKFNKKTWYETYINRPFWASFNKDVTAYAYINEYNYYVDSNDNKQYYNSVLTGEYALEVMDEICSNVNFHDCHTEMRTNGIKLGDKDSHCMARYVNINNCSFDHIWWQPIGSHSAYVNISNVQSNYCLQGIDASTGCNNFVITNSAFNNNIIGFKTASNESYHNYTYNITLDNIKYVNQNKFWTDVVNGNTDPNKSGMFYAGISTFDTQMEYDRFNSEGTGNIDVRNCSFIRNHAYLPRYRNTGNKMASSYGKYTNCIFEYNWSWSMTDDNTVSYEISYLSTISENSTPTPYILSTYSPTNKKFEPLNIRAVKVECPDGTITYIPKNWMVYAKSSWEYVTVGGATYYIINNDKINKFQNDLENHNTLDNLNSTSWSQPIHDQQYIFNYGDGGRQNCLRRTNERQNVDGEPNYTYLRNYSTSMLTMNNCYIITAAKFYSVFGAQTHSVLYNINDSYLIYKKNDDNPLHVGPWVHNDFSTLYPNCHMIYDLNNFYIPAHNTYLDNYGYPADGMYQKAAWAIDEPKIDSYNAQLIVNDRNDITKYKFDASIYTADGEFASNANYPAWYRNVMTGDIDYTTIKRYYPMKNGWPANYDRPNDCVTMYYSGGSSSIWTETECDIVTVHTNLDGVTRWFYPQFLICIPYSKTKTELVEYTLYDRTNGDVPLLRIPNDIMGNSWSSTLWGTDASTRAFLTNNNNEKWNAIIDYYWNSVSNQYGDYTNITRTNFVAALETKCYINDSSKKLGIGRGYYRYPFGNSQPDGSGGTVNVNYLSNVNGITIQEYIHKRYNGRKIEWEEAIYNYFKEDGVLNNLNNNIQSWKEKIGNPPFGKHEIVLTIPFPCRPANFMHNDKLVWGEINGETINFVTQEYVDKGYPMFKNDSSYKKYTNSEARLKAIKWYIDEVLRQLSLHTYENLEMVGFYCIEETIWCNEDIMASVGDYVRSKGLKYYWYPYASAASWTADNHENLIERFEPDQYNVDIAIGQTGWTWKPEKSYQDFLNAVNNYKYFKYGIMYEFNYKMLNSEEICEELLERNIELWKIFKDDPEFLAANNLPKSYIAKSAMMNWYYDAWFPAQITNMSNVYRFNLENHTDAEATEFAEQLHAWQYSTTNYTTGLTVARPTNYEVENGKIYMYYANKAENGRITDIQMQKTAELLDDIADVVYQRNFYAKF